MPKPAAQAAPATIKRGGTLIVGQDVGPVSLDPILTTHQPSAQIYEHLYSTLVQPDPETGKLIPDLAESWEVPDPKTFIFKLRQGVKFHSGRGLTAEDVKYSFDRLLDPKNNAPIKAYVGPIDKIEVLGDYSIKFTQKEVYAPFLNAIADRRPIAIVDRETVEKNDGKLSAVSNGTGPYKLVEYIPDNKIVMERHSAVPRGRPADHGPDRVPADPRRAGADRGDPLRRGPPDVAEGSAHGQAGGSGPEHLHVQDRDDAPRGHARQHAARAAGRSSGYARRSATRSTARRW